MVANIDRCIGSRISCRVVSGIFIAVSGNINDHGYDHSKRTKREICTDAEYKEQVLTEQSNGCWIR